MRSGTRDEWEASGWPAGVSSPAFDDDALWQETSKRGIWDELLGTLVLLALLLAGAALILVS